MTSVSERNTVTRLRELAAERGATVRECSAGHFQVKGALLVNYYPFSKRRSAYIACTTRGLFDVTPMQAVEMAFDQPPIVEDERNKAKRGNQARYQRYKARVWKGGVRACHWCQCKLTLDASKVLEPHFMTLDHRVPLFRGGLDNPNNWVIACRQCNEKRGHDMIELTHKEIL